MPTYPLYRRRLRNKQETETDIPLHLGTRHPNPPHHSVLHVSGAGVAVQIKTKERQSSPTHNSQSLLQRSSRSKNKQTRRQVLPLSSAFHVYPVASSDFLPSPEKRRPGISVGTPYPSATAPGSKTEACVAQPLEAWPPIGCFQDGRQSKQTNNESPTICLYRIAGKAESYSWQLRTRNHRLWLNIWPTLNTVYTVYQTCFPAGATTM